MTLSRIRGRLDSVKRRWQKIPTMRNATDLRQKVLQASLALIEEGGLDRLSMREVARKSGVSHQAPYYYFGDREAILAAIAGEGFLKARTVVRARGPNAKMKRLACWSRRSARRLLDQPSAVRLTISIACWAMVHGLATLIREGTLARTVGVPRARQRQVANEVIGTFTSLFIQDRL